MVAKAIVLALGLALAGTLILWAVLWYLDRRAEEDHEAELREQDHKHEEYLRVYEEEEDVR